MMKNTLNTNRREAQSKEHFGLEIVESLCLILLVAALAVPFFVPRFRTSKPVLERVIVNLKSDMHAARQYSMSHDAIVQASFSMGGSHWSAISTPRLSLNASSATTVLKRVASPVIQRLPWKFTDFTDLNGNSAAPTIRFFPDGKVQGGIAALCDKNHNVRLRFEENGEIEIGWQSEANNMKDYDPVRITGSPQVKEPPKPANPENPKVETPI
jgi:hypothetical protein